MLTVTVQKSGSGGGELLIADQLVCADTPALRRQGVLGRTILSREEGVLLVNPPRLRLSVFHAIHMFGVPFDLALAWLDMMLWDRVLL